MTLHRDHRAPDNAPGAWLAWAGVVLVVGWAVWWMLPRPAGEPTSMEVQVLLPLVVHAAVAAAVGWGLWHRRVPALTGQLALLALGAAVTMEAVALLLVVFPPTP